MGEIISHPERKVPRNKHPGTKYHSLKIMNKRLASVDSLRGFLTVLVVLGHVAVGLKDCGYYKGSDKVLVSNLYHLIYSFHMPVFFAISGYLYGEKRITTLKALGNSLRHRLFTLGIPYLLCSLLYWCIKYALTFLVEAPVRVQDLLWIPLKPIEFFWYLYALLVIYILADVIGYFYGNKVVLCLLFLAVAFFYHGPKSSYGLEKAIPYIGFFYLGCVLRKYQDKIRVLSISGILFFSVAYFYLNKRSWELKFLLAVLGTIFLIQFFSKIKKENLLSLIGQRAMPIYVLHVILVGGIRILLLRSGIKHLSIHFLLGFFIPLAACYWGYDIIKRIPLLDFCFYPGKYRKL